MVLPDYHGGSIVNLMASISAACSATRTPYAPLAALPASELQHARNIILIVIDGMGYNFVMQRASRLREHVKVRITSMFPSTTATAITAFMTGVAPQQHGLVGWFTWFKEVGSVVAPLPFKARHGGTPLNEQGVEPVAMFTTPSIFNSLRVPVTVISPKRIVDSPFNVRHCGGAARRAYDSSARFFREIEEAAKQSSQRKFIYAYYPELDTLAHVHGIASRPVADLFAKLDGLFGAFLGAMAQTESAIIVCADHGFVDVERTIELDQHPELAKMLMLPLCGERRIAYCYVKHAVRARFEDYVKERLIDFAELHESDTLIERGWFGLGEPHPALRERVGDYTVVMKGNYGIKDWVQGETRHQHIGAHGGVTEDEMFVPLILARP